MIKEISSHVKETINNPEKSIKYFYTNRGGGNYDDAEDLLWYPTVNGYFFTTVCRGSRNKSPISKKKNENIRLFEQIQRKIQQIIKPVDQLKRFNHGSVRIDKNVGRAGMICFLCEEKTEILISAKKSRDQQNYNWVLSNLIKHIERCHTSSMAEENGDSKKK